ncbi:SMC-Scp complex subunit ScpB [Rhodopirellula sp. MGV]|uniref:SMC-Scp complex subunit ScpB n=1 Tax=Rhodopirellula sp. MGV TaxID=2023130 RepID=UPI000B96997E|nr:SMC-Scp complex subunit ScpB [Rhodopirellula sp. MGV]OYP34933.1 SMC-Scp complex subunit ScpB [Rhodopirellula sp. MGV]PNY38170.1 SMC-Scp complex subunit ScpB [Rhodopirellula baltica]
MQFQPYRSAFQHPLSSPSWGERAWHRLSEPHCRRPYSVAQPSSLAEESASQGEEPSGAAAKIDEDPIQRRMRVEAVLLLAKNPLTTRKLAQMAHLADGTEARTLVRQLNQLYDDLGRAIRIEQVAGGYRMLSRAAYAPWLGRLEHLPSAIRLSSPMMETLAVVAYRGPVSRADVEAIRGVACGELLRQLMERDLIRISGRSEELGRPYLYDTTKHFLEVFGLPSTDALPPIDWDPLQDDAVEPEPESSSSNFDLK